MDFWPSKDKAIDVHQFKRFVVHCILPWNGERHAFQIILNLRSNFVRVISKGCPVRAEMIGQALAWTLQKFGRVHEFGVIPVVDDAEDTFQFAVNDAHWVCGVLHDLRERSGFSGEAIIEPQKSPFSKWRPGL